MRSLLLRGGVCWCCGRCCSGFDGGSLVFRNVEEDARWRVAAAMADCPSELTVNSGGCRHCHGDGRRGGKLGLGFHV